MFYRKPYLVLRQIVGAEGTVLMINGNRLVACTMATRNRTIIHARIPCTNVDNNDGDLFALDAPKEFDRVLRRFGDKLLALTCDGSRLEIVLPRPGNARGIIWLPMERVNGHMLSVVCQEPTATVRLSVDILIAAMGRVPRGKPWDLLAIQPSDAGLDLRYVVNGATMHERLTTTTVERSNATDPFVCSAWYVANFVRVLKVLRQHGRTVQVQISASRIAIWNEAVTAQLFADRNPSEWTRPLSSDANTDTQGITLFLNRRTADLPRKVGKWLRRLVRDSLAVGEKIDTTWLLSRTLVVANLNCGIETSLEIPCACTSWPLDNDRVCLRVNPLTTAAILECFEEDARGCHLAYHDGLLTIESGSRPYKLTARVSECA